MKIKNPETMLFDHGKSFHFASQVFSKKVFIRVTYLYAFCRFVDDTADEQSADQAQVDLQKISSVLNSEVLVDDSFFGNFTEQFPGKFVGNLVKDFDDNKSNQINDNSDDFSETGLEQDQISLVSLVEKLESYGISKSYLNILVEGALFDVNKKTIQTQSDLIRYCFHVAGVVGLMMCPLIFVRDRKAHAFAVDLGIGMQLTNICRDVLEDAKNERIYLPSLDLKEKNVNLFGLTSQIKITSDSGNEIANLKELVKRQLDLADVYYKSSFKGLAYIPLRPRFAILLASNIYKAIGDKIRKQGYNVLSGRTYLSKTEKVWVSIKAFFKVFHKNFWVAGSHDPRLHVYIQDLVNADLKPAFGLQSGLISEPAPLTIIDSNYESENLHTTFEIKSSPELFNTTIDYPLHNMDFSAGYQSSTTESRNEQKT